MIEDSSELPTDPVPQGSAISGEVDLGLADASAAPESGSLNPTALIDDEHETAESVVIRKNARLRSKVNAAKRHLDTLPKSDRRSRLLHAAVVRRDEVLLDALLQDLDS